MIWKILKLLSDLTCVHDWNTTRHSAGVKVRRCKVCDRLERYSAVSGRYVKCTESEYLKGLTGRLG